MCGLFIFHPQDEWFCQVFSELRFILVDITTAQEREAEREAEFEFSHGC